MSRYICRRLIQSVFVILAVSFVVFMLSHLTGDPAALMLPPDASPEQYLEFRHRMGLDRPLLAQYVNYLSEALRGDLGTSLWHRQPALDLVLERLPATGELALVAMLLSIAIGFPAGILSATRRNSVIDRLSMLGAVLGQAMPVFWLGLMLILIFGVKLHLLPTSGRGGLLNMVLPATTLGAYFVARNARLVRSSLLEVLTQEYITTARSKGLPERVVLWRHALKNAMMPVVTMLGLQVGTLLGGAIVAETVFAWPGLGRLIVQSVTHRDFPLLQAAVLLTSVIFVAINLLVDIIYGFLDPRIRYT